MNGLLAHCGYERKTREELKHTPRYVDPNAGSHYKPIPYNSQIRWVEDALEDMGLAGDVQHREYAVHPEGRQFIWMYVLHLGENTLQRFMFGGRSSRDRSFPALGIYGEACFICDNTMVHGERGFVHKHTKHARHRIRQGMRRFLELAVGKRNELQAREKQLRASLLGEPEAAAIVVNALRQGVIAPNDVLPVMQEFDTPSFPEFAQLPHSRFTLQQAFTHQFKRLGNPATMSKRNRLLLPVLEG